MLIDSTKDLSGFRRKWTGAAILKLLAELNGRVLVDWEVGVGKSTNIDQVIEEAILKDRYDLVVMLAPTRRILDERAWVQSPPTNAKVTNLLPRPFKQCAALDGLWQTYEQNNLGGLGRQELCGSCSNRADCFWPNQFGSDLAGTRVVFATQAHLERSPIFLPMVTSWCKATNPLVILDEANFIMKPAQRRISRKQLLQLQQLIQAAISAGGASWATKWPRFLRVLLMATGKDLDSNSWHVPFMPPDGAILLQKMGRDQWGDDYRFLGYELQLLGKSEPISRDVDTLGNLSFAVLPQIPGDFLIYSGSADHSLTQHRLGNTFSSPFADHRFFHPETRWYNIASRLGTKKFFRNNAPQILDFFGALAAQRLSEGKHVVLVTKKLFAPLCREGIKNRLEAAGLCDIQVLIASDGIPEDDQEQSNYIPIISFGLIGTNLFEHFDCCYCLTGFYVEEKTLHDSVQDLYREDIQLSLEVGVSGRPMRRYARVKDRRHRYCEVEKLAQACLDHLEMGTVIQAVGRVRPYTQPREIITFQCAEHPGHSYDQEFVSLDEARKFFNIENRRSHAKRHTRDQVQKHKNQGLTQRETAKAAGVSLSTVKRHWNVGGGCHEPS